MLKTIAKLIEDLILLSWSTTAGSRLSESLSWTSESFLIKGAFASTAFVFHHSSLFTKGINLDDDFA